MIKKLLNNFRGRNRPTQALIIFLLAIVVMSIMNRMKESRTGNQIQKMKNRIKNDEKFKKVNPVIIGEEVQYIQKGITEARGISMK
ncbi:hypothetical protein N9C10_01500 [Flavobacteriaceae bacterium]|nr:hypothetical protein [Flavobacteriaceae bacterium]